jgi:ribosomal protein S12 methylthiotransferase accessory factor
MTTHSQPTRKVQLRGTHRATALTETVARARQLSATVGITRVANVTGLDRVGMPVVAVYRPNARSLAVSQGKGLDLEAALASGLMEAIESYHAEHPELALRHASVEELSRRDRVCDTSRLPRVAGRRLHPHRALLWVEGLDLCSQAGVYVPYELVHTNFSLPLPPGSGAFLMSSNGLASGNTRSEAVSHALCELIERDALALFHAAGGFSRFELRVDPDSVDDADCSQLLARLGAAELAFGIWEITSDIGLASFVCAVVDRAHDVFHPLYYATGSGCHPVREVALLRAITEAAQCRLTYIAGARDDGDRGFFERARNPDRIAHMRALIEQPLTAARAFRDVPSRVHETLEEDVRWELQCLGTVGLSQCVVVDLGLPHIGLPVVRVLVPGLEPLPTAVGYTPGVRALELARTREGVAR